ncbi:4-hydroxy-tetrahydrodipicolinate synthase [Arenicella chitinivorans]|uniref:4-hydroxy-tetrahydrodipicolinate synthase n=1 Tax=Arenicella chitinivorans TaxID=1329800 RepID=A0A918RL96_9GAMM|nr:4-hydroxy-tetrahydrodipicolinate synthase [Arenicella chitinivorans]GHA00819.1 4-hydroxy-tetrahydrodipicolinate synthase [Arenicella chitinivorans]
MKLEGSIVALITPMQADGSVDFAALTRLIEFHIAEGTDGIVAVGTTGESATLTVDEHLSVIEHTIKCVNKRIPVIAGTGANSTQEAVHLTKHAERLGADAALLVVPYYNKPTQEGLYLHYKKIADSVPIAQLLYNVPGRTVADLHNETVARLADIDNIVGCKDATGDLMRGKALVDLCGDRLTILSGDDATALEYIKLGARGDISVTANVAPGLMSKMCAAGLTGDFAAAEQYDEKLRGLHRDLFLESNPIPVKYAVSKMGYTANALRLPLTPLSAKHEHAVAVAMTEAGISL